MKIQLNQKFSSFSFRHSSGMSLLDVLLGIVIFVVGMLALASLQGNLTRSTADSNARTVGSNIAEETIEGLRTFEKIRTEAGFTAYQDIVDDTFTVPRAGNTYTVNVDVRDFYFNEDLVSVTDDTDDLPEEWDTTISNFKVVDVGVTWAGSEFVVNEGTETSGRLGSGALLVSGIIPSTPQLGSAKVASEDDGLPGTPPIDYTPGARPDIVAINLTDSKFKESMTPMPDVIRRDELVETWFDVVTYNTTGADSIYLRREEFAVLSCVCSLNDNPGSGDGTGFLPTIWNGETYTEGEWVDKAWGESASNQQSAYCDTCCRDHHDSPSHTASHQVYDPSRNASPAVPHWSESGGLDGDHKHYSRANNGSMNVTNNNGDYVEACRLVRKDGFMRVAQDFRQEQLISFPEGYLDTTAGVDEYSDYVTDAVTAFYAKANQPDQLDPASDFSINLPADKLDAAGAADPLDTTTLPLFGLDSQRMRSRGIYLDTLGPELKVLLACIADAGCDAPSGVTNALQVLPFYDIQTTFLSAWGSTPAGTPVSVTSEVVEDDNGHSRGLAVLENAASDIEVTVDTEMRRGNTGLTATDKITPSEANANAKLTHEIYIDLGGGGGDPDPGSYTWSGTFNSSVNQVNATSAVITEGGNTFCTRSGAALSCVTPLDEAGSITITGYTRKQGQSWVDYWICVANFPTATVVNNPAGANNSATISWPANPNPVPTNVILSIEAAACP